MSYADRASGRGPVALLSPQLTLFIPGSVDFGGGDFLMCWGSVYVFVAASLGATFAFLIVDSIFWSSIKKYGNSSWFKALDRTGSEGFKSFWLVSVLYFNIKLRFASYSGFFEGTGFIPAWFSLILYGSLVGDVRVCTVNRPAVRKQKLLEMVWLISSVGVDGPVTVLTPVARKGFGWKYLISRICPCSSQKSIANSPRWTNTAEVVSG